MSQYIIINRIKVQNANAIAGFTWGFPAITNFLGFVQNLSRKLDDTKDYQDITLTGCAVVAHEHQVHTFGRYERRFIQSRNPPYLKKDVDKVVNGKAPAVIEEGKMNMTVSLLVECNGNIGNREEGFLQWLKKACLLQRLAGGTILDIANIQFHKPENNSDVKRITRRILPGFTLLDRSQYLVRHYQELIKDNPEAELLDAWLDFSMLKQKAQPKSDLISKHLQKLIKKEPDNQQFVQLMEIWQQHLGTPYEETRVSEELKDYFVQLEENKANKTLLLQWKNYCEPNEKTDADWEYVPKPETGYLVPIMTGYKAISQVYKNAEVGNTRDNETDVCFVESVHSIGEWQSVHHIKSPEQLQNCLWRYHYEKNWYLCKQMIDSQTDATDNHVESYENIEDEIYS
jgi:CRISPR-associated protein Csy2